MGGLVSQAVTATEEVPRFHFQPLSYSESVHTTALHHEQTFEKELCLLRAELLY